MPMLVVKTLQSELSELKSELYSHSCKESVNTADKVSFSLMDARHLSPLDIASMVSTRAC